MDSATTTSLAAYCGLGGKAREGDALRIRVLGAFAAIDDHGSEIELGRTASKRVLGHLTAVTPDGARPDAIVDTAWGAEVVGSPRPALRMAISRLRRAFAEGGVDDAILHRDGRYFLSQDLRVDGRSFERAVVGTREESDDEECASVLSRALSLWEGPPYDGFEGHLFESSARRLENIRLEAVERLVRSLLRLGRGLEAIHQLHECQAAHPFHEGLVALVMQVHYAAGNQALALDVYEHLRRDLRDELGLEPTPELQGLRLEILEHRLTSPGGGSNGHLLDGSGDSPNIVSVVASGLAAASREGGATTDVGSLSRARVLAGRADTSARIGHWDDAVRDYLRAIDLARRGGDQLFVGDLCLRLARIVWSPESDGALSLAISATLPSLRDGVMASQLRLCLAGGGFRTGAAPALGVAAADLLADLAIVEREGTPVELAWSLMRVRDALAGTLPAASTLEMGVRVAQLEISDPLVSAQNTRAVFADLLRLGRRAEAAKSMRSLRGPPHGYEPAVNAFGRITATNCWNLAMGRFDAVRDGLAAALEYRGRLSAATLDQVVLGQSFWLSRELAESDNLEAHLHGALSLAEADETTPLWRIAAALLATDLRQIDRAASILGAVANDFDLESLPNGSHRTGMLSFVAEILGTHAVAGVDVDQALAERVREQLLADSSEAVLFGWPTVFVGSKERFLGFASLAAGDRAAAQTHLLRAAADDRRMPALRARSLHALSWAADEPEGPRSVSEAIRSALRARYDAGVP